MNRIKNFKELVEQAKKNVEIERTRTKFEAEYTTKLEHVMHENVLLRMRVCELEKELAEK